MFGYGNFVVFEKGSGLFLGEMGFWEVYCGMGVGYDDFDEMGWFIKLSWFGCGVVFEVVDVVYKWYVEVVG